MMDTLYGYPVDTIQYGKFTVQLSFEDEILSPHDVYDIEDEYGREDIENIISGKYTWVIAVITVFKNGIELAKNTLGGCEYDYNTLVEDFKASGYYEDMVSETISEAESTLKRLCED